MYSFKRVEWITTDVERYYLLSVVDSNRRCFVPFASCNRRRHPEVALMKIMIGGLAVLKRPTTVNRQRTSGRR